MDVIIIMCAGILVSKIFFPIKWKRINELLQLICTLLLIFSMGVMLGSREDFLDTITTLGSQSILFFLIPAVFSVIAVYPLTKIFLNDKKGKGKDED
jgi:Na+/citrate or Na+/malate symporter